MIEMKNICKSFGNNLVLDDVELNIESGKILALLGENGAGKSTLMNILGGVINEDQGSINIDGKKVHFSTCAQSLATGIAFIHQELNLINDLPVYENMFLSNEIMKNKFTLDMNKMIEKTQDIFNRLEIHLDPRVMVSTLDASYKQFVEIARALMMKANYIIMDEPTTSLTGPEIERVFNIMLNLKKQGVGIIFISHKLEEVMQICDNYTVLRNGKMVAFGETKDSNPHILAKHMVGHEVRSDILQREVSEDNKVILKVEKLSNNKDFNDISFEVKEKEILGITGLLGDGRSELFLTLFGDTPNYTGKVYLNGKEIKITNIHSSLKNKIAYVPKNRKENAIISDMSILENGTFVSLDNYANRLGVINSNKQNDDFEKEKQALNIKMGKNNDLITSLSGGNQQKVVLSKWLLSKPKVLILDNPTQGVDVGSKEEIYDIIHELAEQGVAIILLSNEAQEIIRTCNRALVMFHGRIQGELKGNEMNDHKIMTLATGSQLEDENKEVSM